MIFNTDMAGQLTLHRAIMFDPDKGWALNTHKRYPDAPRSPFYIDLRAPLRSVPSFRRHAAQYMEKFLFESGVSFDYISDAPQAVTPLVVVLSDMISVPMISPRLNAKDYGLEREVDGFWQAGRSVIIIDDLRTGGGTLRDIIALYRRNGLMVNACFTVIDRSAARDPWIGDVPYFAGFNWDELLDFYRDQHIVASELYNRCMRYPAELEHYISMHQPQPSVA